MEKDSIFNVTLSETVSINVPKATIMTGDDTTVLISTCESMCGCYWQCTVVVVYVWRVVSSTLYWLCMCVWGLLAVNCAGCVCVWGLLAVNCTGCVCVWGLLAVNCTGCVCVCGLLAVNCAGCVCVWGDTGSKLCWLCMCGGATGSKLCWLCMCVGGYWCDGVMV